MTDEIERDGSFVAGFAFAHAIAHAAFRAWLKKIGWISGTHIYPAAADTTVKHLMDRIVHNGHESGWIAYADPDAPHGFRMLKFTYPKES